MIEHILIAVTENLEVRDRGGKTETGVLVAEEKSVVHPETKPSGTIGGRIKTSFLGKLLHLMR